MSSSTKTLKVIKVVGQVAVAITVYALIILSPLYFIMFLDSKVNFSVSNATVVSFSYNNTTTTFTYNLVLFVTIPEMYGSLNYVKATASYLNHTFASKPEETVIQGFTGQRMRFNGEYVVSFTQDQLLTLNNNHMAGSYNITIKIWPSITYPYEIKLGFLKAVVLCDIQVPLQSRVFCGWTNHE